MKMDGHYSRRKFLSSASLATTATLITPHLLSTARQSREEKLTDLPFTILFQGDSITDGNRGRNEDRNHILGHGYAFSIASRLGADYPERNLKFINKGVSGNTIKDLSNRWQQDTIDLKPDVVSILVGINDVYFLLKTNRKPEASFEELYRELIEDTRAKLPGVLLVLCEPFILPVGMVNENLTRWKAEIQARQKVVKKLADEYKTVFVEFQKVFTQACEKAPAPYWIWDGIHPTVPGHELMAREWLNAVSKRLPIITPGYRQQK
jgi:lysophospholipase L1-like esterase